MYFYSLSLWAVNMGLYVFNSLEFIEIPFLTSCRVDFFSFGRVGIYKYPKHAREEWALFVILTLHGHIVSNLTCITECSISCHFSFSYGNIHICVLCCSREFGNLLELIWRGYVQCRIEDRERS